MELLYILGAFMTFATISSVKCSGEGTTSHPKPAISSSSSSHGWIDNVLEDSSPSVSQVSPHISASERHSVRPVSTHHSLTSPGWTENVLRESPVPKQDSLHHSTHLPSKQGRQEVHSDTLATPSHSHDIASMGSSRMRPVRKYAPKEGDLKSKDANWRSNDLERRLRQSTQRAARNEFNRSGLKMDKELDAYRIRSQLNMLKKNNPVRYTRELYNASTWKYNKNSALHGNKAIRKFYQMQPKPTVEQMEHAHLEHRLHLCNLRREKYKRRQKREKDAKDGQTK